MTQLVAVTPRKTKKRIQLGSFAAYVVLSISTFLVAFPFWWMLVVASNKKNDEWESGKESCTHLSRMVD